MPQQKIANKEKVWMPTPVQQKLRDKTITAKKWAEMVKPGEWINRGGPGSDTTASMEALAARLGPGPGDLNNIEIWNQAIMIGNNFCAAADMEAKYHVLHEAFILPTTRGLMTKGYKAVDWKHWGWAIGMDAEYARFYRKEKAKRAMDWGIQACAVPQGTYVNASYGVNNWMIVAKTCKKFVCEIRSDYAWCEGGDGMNLPIDEVDYFIEVDVDDPKNQWPYIAEKDIKPDDIQKAIANHCVSIMRDGDCIQVGIGALPTAVVLGMRDSGLKHLGIHSEMIGEYAFTLLEAGVVDNSRKNIDKGRCGWAYIMPVDTPRYYEWVHRNPQFAGYHIGYTNNFITLSSLDNMVTVNNFAQIDLRGQDAAGNVGGRLFIIPEEKAKEMAPKLPQYPESPSDHYVNFLKACQGLEQTRSPFQIFAPLSQIFSLGIIAIRRNKKLIFNRDTKEVVNDPFANAMLADKAPRKGWESYYNV